MYTIHLSYLNLDNLKGVERLLSYPLNELETLRDRYVLINHTDHPNTSLIVIHEVMYDDLATNNLLDEYARLEREFDANKIDLVIVKNCLVIKNKLKNIFDMVFEKLNRIEDRIGVTFKQSGEFANSIPSIIYDTIWKEFRLIKQDYEKVTDVDTYTKVTILFERRKQDG